MDSELFLDRNEAIIKELNREIKKGLILQRKNSVREGETLTSSVGSFYSPTLEDEIFVALQESDSSSATLRTVLHLGCASWYSENFTWLSNQPSKFYGVLLDDSQKQKGMLHEDITKGGAFTPIQSVRRLDPNFSIVTAQNYGKEIFPYSKIIQLEVEGEIRIVDFTPAITSIANNHDAKVLGLSQFIEKRELPTIELPYSLI